MNPRATTFHLLRTDLRRFRYFIAAFLLLAAVAAVVERAPVSRGAAMSLASALRLAQVAVFLVLVVQVFLADSAAHTRSQWWTRPIGGGALLASKLGYVVVALWAPLTAIQVAGWVWDGFTARQIGLAVAEWSLYVLGTAALAGGLAAAASRFSRLVAMIGLVVAGVMASIGLATLTGWRIELPGAIGAAMGTGAGFVATVFLSFAAAGLISFVAVYVARRPRWVALAIAVVAVSPLWWQGPRRGPRERGAEPVAGGAHERIAVAPPPAGAARDDLLFRNLALRDLPADQFAVPLESEFIFTDRNDRTALFEYRSHPFHWAGDFGQEALAVPLLQRSFPAGTNVHFGRGRIDPIGFRTRVVTTAPDLDVASPGRLAGDLEYLLCEVVALGPVPLRRGARLTDGGHSIQVIDFDESGSTLDLDVRVVWPRLLASPELDDSVSSDRRPWSSWVVVAYFPQWEEAEAVPVRSHGQGGPFPIRVWRDERLRFTRPVEGAGEVEVRAFRIVALGAYRESFAWDGHRVAIDPRIDGVILPGEITDSRSDGGSGAGGGERRTPEAAIASLDTVEELAAFHADLTYPQSEALREKAVGLMEADLDGALARVPWPGPAHRALVEVLVASTDEAHLPAFREALSRDARLFEVVEKRGWDEAFRAEIVGQLARRSPHVEPAVIRMAADFRDPDLADALRWQFIHNARINRQEIYGLLEAVPGLDARAALEAAWDRALAIEGGWDLLNPALRHGLPGAVEAAVRRLHVEGLPEPDGASPVVEALRAATDYAGDPGGFVEWIDRHAADLVFDERSGRHRLPD